MTKSNTGEYKSPNTGKNNRQSTAGKYVFPEALADIAQALRHECDSIPECPTGDPETLAATREGFFSLWMTGEQVQEHINREAAPEAYRAFDALNWGLFKAWMQTGPEGKRESVGAEA